MRKTDRIIWLASSRTVFKSKFLLYGHQSVPHNMRHAFKFPWTVISKPFYTFSIHLWKSKCTSTNTTYKQRYLTQLLPSRSFVTPWYINYFHLKVGFNSFYTKETTMQPITGFSLYFNKTTSECPRLRPCLPLSQDKHLTVLFSIHVTANPPFWRQTYPRPKKTSETKTRLDEYAENCRIADLL